MLPSGAAKKCVVSFASIVGLLGALERRTIGLRCRNVFWEVNGVDFLELRPGDTVSFALRIPTALFEGMRAITPDGRKRTSLFGSIKGLAFE